ncbi:MFS transporter [Mesorhizobium sp.]|uniref:MFS transporter n=1 Tax=Mesorhizobium sp. TaxID=1871066 RepID=UPI000FEA85BF|nr:MFS transporter [Mesorhizobium sp.]RWK31380.1 MAG: MFS transporter [Mesorhizobium sp.]RWK63342.1 MAG: MFS transporter [Mesorhizobium sp.]RWK71773.1 MAG: MFS transporter [Mesorhizobium sp.]RWK75061.1 MAG: MFS transporter [Mesorhizobium sp.]RWK99669.1 MAG: MFS transporter [Mesorhizobium sp.]
METTYDSRILDDRTAWGAVLSMALCVAVLIASEFMPVSLLSPIAVDLGISEGQTGQAISISGAFAVVTSLLVAGLTRRIDRKLVVTGFTVLLIVSGLATTFAPNFALLMVGRALLGVAIGGFWSMSTSIVMRLVSEDRVPKGLAMLNAGNAIAATIAAPLGSFLGAYVGWRGAFFLVVPLGLLALVWQWISLPPLPPRGRRVSGNVLALLGRRPVALGMASILFLFMGQFALFTYLRPFLESVTGVGISALAAILLVIGLAGVAGTWCIGRLLHTRLFSILIVIPLVMSILAIALIALGSTPVPVALLLLAWGFVGTAAPVAWGTWLSRTLPDDAEAGGGLQVATIQLAITGGAAIGGTLFDAIGWWGAFAFGAALLCGSSLLALVAWRTTRRALP